MLGQKNVLNVVADVVKKFPPLRGLVSLKNKKILENQWLSRIYHGGDKRDRTADLLNATSACGGRYIRKVRNVNFFGKDYFFSFFLGFPRFS